MTTEFEKNAKALEKSLGSNEPEQEVKFFIDTGFPPLNKIMSGRYDGGIPGGRITEIFGPSQCGKTALATHLMIETQKMGGVAMLMDHERSFDLGVAIKSGLNDKFPYWVYKRPRTWEESNMFAIKAAKEMRDKGLDMDIPILCIFDSVAAMCPQSSIEKDFDKLTMNDTTALSRVTSSTLRSMTLFCDDYNLTCIYLNQIRTKPGVVHGDPTTTPGGAALGFYSNTRLSLGRTMEYDKAKNVIGQTVKAKCVKSRMTKPFSKTTMAFKFREDGSGYFDPTVSIFDAMIEKGIIEKDGGWLIYEGVKLQKTNMLEHIKTLDIMELAKGLGEPESEIVKAAEEEAGEFS